MKSFNFGESIQRWVCTFYNNIQSCVMNNGMSSGYFDVNSGVRQGDPLSSVLFVVAMEVLLINIRNNKDIEGIQVNMDVNIKCSCYADDLTCFLKDIKSADNMLRTLDMFYSCSSLKVNVEKTEAMWLGSCRNFNNTPLPMAWTKHVKVLGIFFSYNEQLANDLNFDAKITSLKQTPALWTN